MQTKGLRMCIIYKRCYKKASIVIASNKLDYSNTHTYNVHLLTELGTIKQIVRQLRVHG